MRKKKVGWSVLILVYVLLCLELNAQNQEWKSTNNDEQILNGAAIFLKRPAYPPEAKAAKIFGEVLIKINLNKKGRVTQATAVSGHPVLAEACRKVALESTFSVKKLKNKTGILIYNFDAT